MSYLLVASPYLPDLIWGVLRMKNLFPFWAMATVLYFLHRFSAVLLPGFCRCKKRENTLFHFYLPYLFLHSFFLSAEFSIRGRPLRGSAVKGSSILTNLLLQNWNSVQWIRLAVAGRDRVVSRVRELNIAPFLSASKLGNGFCTTLHHRVYVILTQAFKHSCSLLGNHCAQHLFLLVSQRETIRARLPETPNANLWHFLLPTIHHLIHWYSVSHSLFPSAY